MNNELDSRTASDLTLKQIRSLSERSEWPLLNCPAIALGEPGVQMTGRLLQLTSRSSLGLDVRIAPLRDRPKCSHNFITRQFRFLSRTPGFGSE
jgi:hypothetical protein